MQTEQQITNTGYQINNYTLHIMDKVYNFSKQKVNRKALKGLSPHRAERHKLAFYLNCTNNVKPRKLKKLRKQLERVNPIMAGIGYITDKMTPRFLKYATYGSDLYAL